MRKRIGGMKGPKHKSADFARPRANAGEILCLEAWEVKDKIQQRLPILETLQAEDGNNVSPISPTLRRHRGKPSWRNIRTTH